MARSARLVFCLPLAAAAAIAGSSTVGHAATGTEPDDEIHVDYGNSPGTSMWVHWRGPDTSLAYGRTSSYGITAASSPAWVTPVDIGGSFREVELTGLNAGTTYHYSIGPDGFDHTFETAPTGDFRWDDVGDTGTTFYDPAGSDECDKPWMAQVWQQLANDQPDVVTHGGDISYANECGQPSVHQFYDDIEPIAEQAPIEFAWGNHEYGPVPDTAPPGTPRDNLANYKGRSTIPNPQTVPNDTANHPDNPGCPSADGTKNRCVGQDWGSFQVGHVLFITYPEPWTNAYADWTSKAGALMARAQADPNVSFIVTYGHRPAYTSLVDSETGDFAYQADLRTAVTTLAKQYSPTGQPGGKYVLNVNHHIHGGELFSPINGVINVTDGGGGSEETNFGSHTAPNSLWKTVHPEHLRVDVTGDTMNASFICGPVFTPNPTKDACTAGSVLRTFTITGGSGPTTPSGPTEYVDNSSVENDQTGWTGRYNSGSTVADVQPADGAFDGTWALSVKNAGADAGPAGVNNIDPNWVVDTEAGTTYSASAEVKGTSGTVMQLLIRECTSAGSCGTGYKHVDVTLTGGWQSIALDYPAVNGGDELKYSLYALSLPSKGTFLADDLELSSS